MSTIAKLTSPPKKEALKLLMDETIKTTLVSWSHFSSLFFLREEKRLQNFFSSFYFCSHFFFYPRYLELGQPKSIVRYTYTRTSIQLIWVLATANQKHVFGSYGTGIRKRLDFFKKYVGLRKIALWNDNHSSSNIPGVYGQCQTN